MKFRDFILKHLLADTDYLVGYDNKGDYIRIGKNDLAASVASNVTVPTLQVKYSSNGSSWHDSYSSGDIYLRIKVGSGEWSSAIRISVSAYDIWREQGNSGDESVFLESILGSTIYTSHTGVVVSDEIIIDEQAGENHVTLDYYSNNVYVYAGKSSTLEISIDHLVKHLGKKQHVTIINSSSETITINIVNIGGDILIADSQFTLNDECAATMEILTTTVGEMDNKCCKEEINVDFITTVCIHIGEIIKKIQA